MSQLAFGDEVRGEAAVSEHRVRALAGTIAGFAWPGHGVFEKLSKARQQAALDEARAVLGRLAAIS